MPPRLIRKLGEGGMGEVWLAEDPARGPVALKRIRPGAAGTDALARFRVEFATLSRLCHPNLVQAYEYFVDDATALHAYTMEFVDGLDFTAATGGLPAAAVAALAEQVCSALDCVHDHDLVHGDVKPGNLIVRDGLVKLMDFGLATRPGTGALQGSLDYLAPEIIQRRPHDRRADLYALGAVLFEAFTRHPPFTGNSRFALLRAHLRSRPAFPARASTAVPEPHRRLVLRLLCKDPSARFFTAAEVAEALRAARGAAGKRLLTPSALSGGGLAGREEALSRLEAAVREAGAGTGPVFRVLSGPVGSGKARVLREFRARLAARRVPCAAAACARAEAPLAPAREWLEGLAAHVSPDWARLRAALEIARSAGAGAVAGVAAALDAASRRATLVLTLESAEWADQATAELVASLRLRPYARIAIVAAVTPGEGSSAWDSEPGRIDLVPLGTPQIADLARAMAGAASVDPDLAADLARASGGIPGAARACLRNLAARDALFIEDGRLGSSAPPTTGPGMERVLEFLGTDARLAAEALAVLGGSRDDRAVAQISGLAPDRAAAALFDLERRGIAAREDSLRGSRHRLLAPASVPAILARAPARAIREMNRAAAAVELARPEPLPEEVARFLFGAGGGSEAASWGLRAAEHAAAAGDAARAAELLERVLAEPELPSADRRAASRLLAEAHERAGRTEAASDILRSLLEDAPPAERLPLRIALARTLSSHDPQAALDALDAAPETAEIRAARAEALFRLGRFQASLSSLAAGNSPPENLLRARALLVLGRAPEAAAEAAASGFESAGDASRAAAVGAEAAAALRDTASASAAAHQAVTLAARAGSVRAQLAALTARARLLQLRGETPAALDAWRRAADMARSTADAESLARALTGTADLLWECDRLDESARAASWASEAAGRARWADAALAADLALGRAAAGLGRFSEAESALTRAVDLAAADAPGRPLAAALSARAAARLAAGRIPDARADADAARAADPAAADPLLPLELAVAEGAFAAALNLATRLSPAGPRDAARLRFLRAHALLLAADPTATAAAVDEYYELLSISRQLAVPSLMRRAHHGLGRALASLHMDRAARDHFRHALDLLRDTLTHMPPEARAAFLALEENQELRRNILSLRI